MVSVFFGLFIGMLSGCVAFLCGASLGGAIIAYVVGANLGVGLSVLILFLRERTILTLLQGAAGLTRERDEYARIATVIDFQRYACASPTGSDTRLSRLP